MRPLFIICNWIIEQKRIASALGKKLGMVAIRIGCMFVFSETFVLCIIIHYKGFACPTFVAFYPEMIIGFSGQGTVPAPRLKYSLCQRDRCRNFILLHLFDGHVFIQIDVVFRTLPLLCQKV